MNYVICPSQEIVLWLMSHVENELEQGIGTVYLH